jgi:hypothetical protein
MTDQIANVAETSVATAKPLKKWQILTRTVIVVIAIEVALVFVIIGGYKHFVPFAPGLSNEQGNHYGHDFLVFYSSAQLALHGKAENAYVQSCLEETEGAVVGLDAVSAPWVYPPTFLLFVLPFGLLPYIAGYAAWCVTNLAAGVIAGLGILKRWWIPFAVCLFPGSWLNLYAGQNGGLSAALLLGGLGLLERFPIAAGTLFGLLSYKPQFGLLIPLALIAGRHWSCFASATATVIVLAIASYIAFGAAPWEMFLLNYQTDWLWQSDMFWAKSLTVYPMARLAGLGPTFAATLQIVSAAAAACIVLFFWRRPTPIEMRATVLTFGTLLTTPRALMYDLAILLVPILFLLVRTSRYSLLQDWVFLAFLWLSPVAGYLYFNSINFQTWPVLLWAAMLYSIKRYGGASPSLRGTNRRLP